MKSLLPMNDCNFWARTKVGTAMFAQPDDLDPSADPEQRSYFPYMSISHDSHQLYPISSWYARYPTVPPPPVIFSTISPSTDTTATAGLPDLPRK